MRFYILTYLLSIFTSSFCQTINSSQEISYTLVSENMPHEGTWLQWPHHYQYGTKYRNDIENTWISMIKALITSEKVHVITYNSTEKNRITTLLKDKQIRLDSIDFTILKTNDVWIRDNGPVFVKDSNNITAIEDWGFNGWGYDVKYKKCDRIPTQIAQKLTLKTINLEKITLENGAIEIDGKGTLIATRSSIVHKSRNPKISEKEIESYFKKYLGINNTIWLEGKYGSDITDMHIDGFLKFANDSTIVTMKSEALNYWGLSQFDINKINTAKNSQGIKYHFYYLPLTKKNVTTSNGETLKYKGSYCNYYVANTVVLVPIYNDENDQIALKILQNLYPKRKIIGIDSRNIYKNGGMIHCVTMQQPK